MAELPGSMAERLAALEASVAALKAELESWDLLQQTTQDLLEQTMEINAGLEKRIKRLEEVIKLQIRAKHQAQKAAIQGGGS